MPVPPLGRYRSRVANMRSREEVAAVLELVKAGWNDCEIARELGIPRGTVRDWRRGKSPDLDRVRTRLFSNGWVCVVCRGDPLTLPRLRTRTSSVSTLAMVTSPPTPGACTGCGSAAPTSWFAALGWVQGVELGERDPYPRYHFSNVSADIRGIFGRACDQLGIEWRPNNRISRRARSGAGPPARPGSGPRRPV